MTIDRTVQITPLDPDEIARMNERRRQWQAENERHFREAAVVFATNFRTLADELEGLLEVISQGHLEGGIMAAERLVRAERLISQALRQLAHENRVEVSESARKERPCGTAVAEDTRSRAEIEMEEKWMAEHGR